MKTKHSMLLLLLTSIWLGGTSGAAQSGAFHTAFAATTSASTSTSSSSEHHSGRRWKNRRKRQRFIPPPVRTITVQEEEALLDQLGYVPPNVCTVSARSGFIDEDDDDDAISINNGVGDEQLLLTDKQHSKIDTSSKGVGRPIAIQSYPLLVQILSRKNKNGGEESNERSKQHYNYTPFPTMYWLTDPHVSRAIAEIERNGYVRKFQSRLEEDASLAKDWFQCHEDYAAERWKLLSKSDRDWLLLEQLLDEDNIMSTEEQRKIQSMREMIMLSGVAGTDHRRLREKDDNDDKRKDTASLYVPSVKCLHSHYAHYRSQKERSDNNTVINIIGKWTHDLLTEEFPDLIL